jgi:hypothetical protein
MKKIVLTSCTALLLGLAQGCRSFNHQPGFPRELGEMKEVIIETITHNGATFEIVARTETVFAGKAYYSDNGPGGFGSDASADNEKTLEALGKVVKPLPSDGPIHVSVDFWKPFHTRLGFIFVKETETKNQPEGVDVFVMPASLFIRGTNDAPTTRLLNKEICELYELYALMRYEVMPKHGYKMAENGAQEIEYFSNVQRTYGWAYIPVARIEEQK